MPLRKVEQMLSKLERYLIEVREALLECSRECLRADDAIDRQLADKFFTLAKDSDLLRRETILLKRQQGERESIKELHLLPDEGSPTTVQALRMTDAGAVRGRRKRQEGYPKYGLRGEFFVKTGLGRDRKTEYEHVVPKEQFERIIIRLAEMKTNRRQFTTENVQESLNCPIYQTYVVLSLMRHLGLLVAKRKGTYSFSDRQNFPLNPNEIWNRVPTL